MMSSRTSEFAAYIPELILRRLERDPEPPPEGEGSTLPAVVMFADVAGSTKLANQLAGLGRLVGPEEMARILNAYYGPLVALIQRWNGDVVGFAGDAVLAIWPATRTGLADAIRQATHAALEIQRDLNNLELAKGVRLSLRICIGAGELHTALVGGVQQFWQLIAYGPPLDQIREAGDLAQIGKVFLSREANEHLGIQTIREAHPDGGAFVLGLSPETPLQGSTTDLSTLTEDALRPYVPRAVQESIDAGLSDFLDQSRTISTLFVRIVPEHGAAPAWKRMQTTMELLQKTMARYEGTVAQLMQDDKGLVAVLAFGLPPVGHEDDAGRAIESAIYLRELASERGVACAIGVSTGVPFCGPLGGQVRRCYTVTGADVIRAARLMQAANAGEILCDEATQGPAQHRTTRQFQTLPRFQLKGFDVPVRVFRVLRRGGSVWPISEPAEEATTFAAVRARLHASELGPLLVTRLRDSPSRVKAICEELLTADRLEIDHGVCEVTSSGTEKLNALRQVEALLVGREREIAGITAALEATISGSTRMVLVEGDTGSGKSRLLEEAKTLGKHKQLQVIAGRCSSVETATPYYPWRAAFEELLGLPGFNTATGRGERVLGALQAHPQLIPFAALLNDLLGLELPQDAVIQQMTGQTRADNLHDLLIALLTERGPEPLLILLEDFHWADTASWRLAKLVRERRTHTALGLSIRHTDAQLPAEYEQIVGADWADRFVLDSLDQHATRDLAQSRFGVRSLSEPLSQLIWRRTQGNPLFIEQVIDHLRAAGLVEYSERIATLKSTAGTEETAAVPDTIRGLVTARIDRLRPAHQLTAKVSSVIGPLFPRRALAAIHPDPTARAVLPEHTAVLQREQLIRLDRPDPDAVFDFPHPVLQQVCYELLPRPQRQRLHTSAAEWFEADQREGASPQFRLIAHHWGRAGVVEAQLRFLEKAGDVAVRDGAYREAVTGFTELLRLSRERSHLPTSTEEEVRRAHAEYQLGEAHFGLGELPASLTNLRLSLASHGRPQRRSSLGLLLDTFLQVGRQFARRLLPWRNRKRDASGNTADLEAASAFLRIARVSYYMNDILPGLNSTIRALNLAESAGPSTELAMSYASVMVVTGLLNFHRAARIYAPMAESVAREIGKQPTLSVVLAYLCMYRMGQGDWQRIEAMAQEALEIAERFGDHHQCGEVATILAMACCFRTDYSEAMKCAVRMTEAAKRSGNNMHLAWALNVEGECLFRLGRSAEAEPKLLDSALALHGNQDRTEEIRILGLRAALAARAKCWDEASIHAETAEGLFRQSSTVTCSTLEGLAGIAEIRFKLAERTPGDRGLIKKASQSLVPLRKHAKLFPIGRPRLALFEGWLLQLKGSQAKAQRKWQAGLEQANHFAMPLESGFLQQIIARFTDGKTEQQRERLEAAAAIFEQSGMAFELAEVRAELAQFTSAQDAPGGRVS